MEDFEFTAVKGEPLDTAWAEESTASQGFEFTAVKGEPLDTAWAGESTASQVSEFTVLKEEPLDIPCSDESTHRQDFVSTVLKEEPLDIPCSDESADPQDFDFTALKEDPLYIPCSDESAGTQDSEFSVPHADRLDTFRPEESTALKNSHKRQIGRILTQEKIHSLADELKEIRALKTQLLQERECIQLELKRAKEKFGQLYCHILQEWRFSSGKCKLEDETQVTPQEFEFISVMKDDGEPELLFQETERATKEVRHSAAIRENNLSAHDGTTECLQVDQCALEKMEYEAFGINVHCKLEKMDRTQAVYAEKLIQSVLCKGLLNQLTPSTSLCENPMHHMPTCSTKPNSSSTFSSGTRGELQSSAEQFSGNEKSQRNKIIKELLLKRF